MPSIDRICCSIITVPKRKEWAPTIRPFSISIISVVPPAISRIMESLCCTERLSSFRQSQTAMYISRFSSIPSITRTIKPVFIFIRSTKGSRLAASRTADVPNTVVSLGKIPQAESCSAKRFIICRQETILSLLIKPCVKTSRPILTGSSLLSRILRFLSAVISATKRRIPVDPISITA